MTPEQLELERQAFEAWYNDLKGFGSLERVGDTYAYSHADYAWQAWQARAQQSAWISTKERLPETPSQCLVSYKPPFATGQQTIIVFFNNGVFRLGNSCGGNISHAVTHWQPLPEPPKAA